MSAGPVVLARAPRVFAVGDLVRSYDFAPRPERGDCFVEGEVVSVVDGLLALQVRRDVFCGQEMVGEKSRIGSVVQTATELHWGEWEGRLVLIPLQVLGAVATEAGPGRYSIDASELGLAPGSWPKQLPTTLGNGKVFFLLYQDDAGALYRQEGGAVRLRVFND